MARVIPTTSTLNKKLPTMQKIAFCSSAGKDMATGIYAGSNGVFSCKVGFKQTSKSYPFQIQYRQRSRYTDANAKVVGAAYNDWTDWKAVSAIENIVPADGTEEDYPVDDWMAANQGVNKKATYLTCYEFSEYMIPADYDAREFQFRVRTFNKSKAKHGNWASETLTVYKRAVLADETPITRTDGGLVVKFNYIWDKPCSVYVNSVKDVQGRELLKKALNLPVEFADLDAQSTPAARTGYVGGKIEIPVGSLKRRIEVGESLDTDIQFITVDGATTYFTLGTVQAPYRDIELSMSYTFDADLGIVCAEVVNVDEVPIVSLGANITYIYHGKEYSIPPIEEDIDFLGTSKFYFYAPIGINFDIHACAEDANALKDNTDILNAKVSAKGWRFNKDDDMAVGAIAWGNVEIDITSTPVFESSIPYGRTKNIIFYGDGTETAITFNATIVDRDNCYGGMLARKNTWDDLRTKQGVYYLRSSRGDLYKVGMQSINIVREATDLYTISLELVEVA